MQYQLTCEQVNALMPFFLEEKLTTKLSKCVKQHLEKCPICMQKYIELKNILKKENQTTEISFPNKRYENYKKNLSAYVDNELDDEENIKIKKFAISNSQARQDLEDIYSFKRLMNQLHERTKQELKTDYSKIIINQLVQEETENYNYLFNKIIICFTILISILVLSIISFLYF